MKVLITDDVHPLLLHGLRAKGYQCDYKPEISLSETKEIIEEYYGAVINSKIKADRSFLNRGSNLKFIARLGSGLEIIDLDEAQKRSISVISAPEGNCNAVAEHAVGMLLCLTNKLLQADRDVREMNWDREKHRGREIQGSTVGILGYGHTGPAFAAKLSGFDVNVLVYDKFKPDLRTEAKHVKFCDLKTIQNQSDIISLHVSLNPSSYHLIDRTFIMECGKPFILINTSRGNVVKMEDLIWGIETGKVEGACLDVFENENPVTYNEDEKKEYDDLHQMDQVVLSPHVAGWTVESKKKIAETILKKLDNTEIAL